MARNLDDQGERGEMRFFEAVLFDMDGVLVDTHHSVTAFWQMCAKEHELSLTPTDFSEHVYGRPADHTIKTLFPHFTSQQHEELLERLRNYECTCTYQEIQGAVALLQTLRQHAVPMALVTGAEIWKVEAVIRQFGLDNIFATWITASDSHRGKPHPECYLAAAQALQKDPLACLVFEDAINGVKAAVAAGAYCIGISSSTDPAALQAAGAGYVLPDFQAVYVQKTLPEGNEGLELKVNRSVLSSSLP